MEYTFDWESKHVCCVSITQPKNTLATTPAAAPITGEDEGQKEEDIGPSKDLDEEGGSRSTLVPG
jgi:hypothetical protein